MLLKLTKIFSPLFIVASIMLVGCRDDFDMNDNNLGDYEGAIRINANMVGPVASTKAIGSDNKVPITEGSFKFLYPYYWQNATTIPVTTQRMLFWCADVNFGEAGIENIGIPSMSYQGVITPVTWNTSNNGNNISKITKNLAPYGVTIFMDNSPLAFGNYPDTIPTITATYKTMYSAGIYDPDVNDPLWGTATVEKDATLVEIDLQHILSRIKVNITVDRSMDQALDLDLSDAILKIDNVILEPTKYNRVKGEFVLPDNKYSEFLLVDHPRDAETLESEENELEWGTIDITNPQKTIYKSKDFVVPPQVLKDDDSRPRLILLIPSEEVKKGIPGLNIPDSQEYVEFSNYLPRSLTVLDTEGHTTGVSMMLNFLRGYILTLNTTLVPGDMELKFMPVTVEPWVEKGGSVDQASQASVASYDDLKDLIKNYNEGNKFRLSKYGFYTGTEKDGHWVFQFRNSYIEMDQKEIQGSMIPGDDKPDYEFEFGNRSETLKLLDGNTYSLDESAGQKELKTITSTLPKTGIQKPEDFYDLISSYQTNSWKLYKYGDYSVSSDSEKGTWTFNFEGDFDLDYNKILSTMIPQIMDYNLDFSFDFKNHNITVNNQPNSTGNVTSENLKTIVSQKEAGIYTTQDFYDLCSAWEEDPQSDEKLCKYGTKESDGSWNFDLKRNIVLEEEYLQGMMQTGEDKSYNLEFGDYTVNMWRYDGSLYVKIPDNQLITILKREKLVGILSAFDFYNLTSIYTNLGNEDEGGMQNLEKLYKYGYLNTVVNPDKWVFLINSNIEVEYQKIKGSMLYQSASASSTTPPYGFTIGTNLVTIKDESGQVLYQYTMAAGSTNLYNITYK